jgi:hypothetical protein
MYTAPRKTVKGFANTYPNGGGTKSSAVRSVPPPCGKYATYIIRKENINFNSAI